MTNQETLTKAIEKAIAGGWDSDDRLYQPIEVEGYVFVSLPETPHLIQEPHFIIFNHDFAKSIWSYDEEAEIETSEFNDQGHEVIERWKEKYPAWKFHLQQMVIADDPIKYLSENL